MSISKMHLFLRLSLNSARASLVLMERLLLKPTSIRRFNFEVTRRCNGRCVYCNIWKTPSNPRDELKPDEIRECFKPRELFRKVELIGVTGGEPFLRDDLVELCQALREACPNARFGLVTNGLNPDRTISLMSRIRGEIDPYAVCGVSMDGFPEVDALTRGNIRHFDLAWRTIEGLREIGAMGGVGSTLIRVNLCDALKFKHWLQDKGLDYGFEIASLSEHYYDNADLDPGLLLDNNNPRHIKMIEELSRGGATFIHYQPEYFRKPRQLFPCMSGFNSFFLNHVGDVYPCIHLSKRFGNLRETSFKELWTGPAAKKVRRIIRDGRCYCWTACEASNTIRTLVYPVILKYIKKLIGGE